MASNGVMTRRNFRRIWIAGKKTLVKWAPGPYFKSNFGNIRSIFLNEIYGVEMVLKQIFHWTAHHKFLLQ